MSRSQSIEPSEHDLKAIVNLLFWTSYSFPGSMKMFLTQSSFSNLDTFMTENISPKSGVHEAAKANKLAILAMRQLPALQHQNVDPNRSSFLPGSIANIVTVYWNNCSLFCEWITPKPLQFKYRLAAAQLVRLVQLDTETVIISHDLGTHTHTDTHTFSTVRYYSFHHSQAIHEKLALYSYDRVASFSWNMDAELLTGSGWNLNCLSSIFLRIFYPPLLASWDEFRLWFGKKWMTDDRRFYIISSSTPLRGIREVQSEAFLRRKTENFAQNRLLAAWPILNRKSIS